MSRVIRIQGQEFANKRKYLEMVSYAINDNGHVRADLREKKCEANKNRYIRHYRHWMSNEEIKKFVKSEYFLTHEPVRGDKLRAAAFVGMKDEFIKSSFVKAAKEI